MTDVTRATTETSPDWEQRVAEAWAAIESYTEDDFVRLIGGLADELPAGSAVGAFERACAWDSTGHSDLAVPLYRQALETGLTGIRRRRAVIQMSSSLRNIGRADESVVLLTAEREAVSVAVAALAPHLPRYQRSMANYARLLVEP